jgi:hypothetical protein
MLWGLRSSPDFVERCRGRKDPPEPTPGAASQAWLFTRKKNDWTERADPAHSTEPLLSSASKGITLNWDDLQLFGKG